MTTFYQNKAESYGADDKRPGQAMPLRLESDPLIYQITNQWQQARSEKEWDSPPKPSNAFGEGSK
ncbi:hypothetical protein ACFV9C_33850 [Kribbella sp. NPDC059898]|uniref:hypothetical protein n=1 Tax=Kribbella sp. NPDC059898 TaxID=3346995 RepID=UPI0036695600